MAKTRIFKVANGRMHFKCTACKTKRMVTVPPNARFRSIKCQKCGELTTCNLNRRQAERTQQLGKVLAVFPDGRQFEVHLADISLYGVGFNVNFRDINKFVVGKEVRFQCSWSPQLLGSSRYIIRSIKGQRVGAQVYR